MSPTTRHLLTVAAELRAVGHPWEAVARQVHRQPKTCQHWPARFRADWDRLYRSAQLKRFEEMSNEARTHLNGLMRSDDPKVKQKAVEVWLKCGANAFGPRGGLVQPAAPGEPAGPPDKNAALLQQAKEQMAEARDRIDRRRAHEGLPPTTDREFMAEWDAELEALRPPPAPPVEAEARSTVGGASVALFGLLLVVAATTVRPGPDRSPTAGRTDPDVIPVGRLVPIGSRDGGGFGRDPRPASGYSEPSSPTAHLPPGRGSRMFRVVGDRGLSRRSFVQAGLLGVGGLTLPDFLRIRAQATAGSPGTSVILFWMSGGPGHMETWDPKPDAVSQFRGPFGAIKTNVPGVQFGELMPRQARIADKIAVARTVAHGSGDHTKGNHWMLTGFEGPAFNVPDFQVQRRPCLGSAASKLRGANRPGVPAYVAVPHLRGGTDNFFHYAAYLGPAHNPFNVDSDPNQPAFRVRNLALPKELPLGRLEDRRDVLGLLDQVRRAGDRGLAARDATAGQAFSLLTSREVVKAFDITAEPAAVRDRYGRHIFGQSALLARRLVEAGVTFVTVNTEPWDHHATAGRLPTAEGGRKLIPPFDAAFASLVDDLHQRGLADRVLVVAMGEFGRTPRMNPEGGRDHWGNTFSVAFAGGRLKTGQAVGKSNPRGEYPIDRPLTPEDVTATVFHHLGIDAKAVSFPDRTGRPIYLVEHGEPIRELVG